MNSNGSGLTFSEHDVNMAKRLIGLMNQTKFNLDANQMVLGAEAMLWLQRDLVKNMQDNIFEVNKVIDTKKESSKKADK